MEAYYQRQLPLISVFIDFKKAFIYLFISCLFILGYKNNENRYTI